MLMKTKHPLYRVWTSMKGRCQNPNFRQWNDYGGRGITVCERWKSDFYAFVEDMGPRPDGYSIDRIDNDKGYSPENCRWASRRQQQRNQRRARYVEVEGVEYRAMDLAKQAGVKTDTIIERAARGLPLDEVVSTEKRQDLSGLALGGAANGERQRKKTHCPRGHEYTEKNTITDRHGWRRCRTCFYAKEAKLRARRRAKRTGD